MRLVLDSSALLSGTAFEGELFTASGVISELRKHGMTTELAIYLEAKVRILTPQPELVERIKVKASETGDIRRLSPVDVSVLALAMELDATLVTDDYSMENIAKALGMPYRTVMLPPIKEEVHWKYRCTGCRKFWPDWHEACPVCGASLKTSRPRAR